MAREIKRPAWLGKDIYMRSYSLLDRLCINIEQAITTIWGTPQGSSRPDPAQGLEDTFLEQEEKRVAQGLLRVNHTGEVCAQALYQGQALTARLSHVREKMEQAAIEENDHLIWCARRLQELGTHTSYLNSFWYLNSFLIGAIAGAIGDRWSLGFVAETERQVVEHLEEHHRILSEKDKRSHAIIKQMKVDEALHQQMAIEAGAANLPHWVQKAMRFMSKCMTKTVYWI